MATAGGNAATADGSSCSGRFLLPDSSTAWRPPKRRRKPGRWPGWRAGGGLNPDSEATGYVHSIRQWTVWTAAEGFDEKRFTEAFVERTRQQRPGPEAPGTKEMERAVRAAAPNRWRDINAGLSEAQRTAGPR